VLAAACAADAPSPRVPPRPSVSRVAIAPTTTGSFWEPEPFELHPSALAAEPVTEQRLVRIGGAAARWDAEPELREKLLHLGFAVVPRESDGTLASFYRGLEASRTPAVLTVDALLLLVHAVMDAALSEVDAALAPELKALVETLDDRLAREAPHAKPDAAAAYARARGIVSVARALIEPRSDASDLVNAEVALVRAHMGPAPSPVLERTIDYSMFDVARGFRMADDRLGSFRAAIWLGVASLELGTREAPHAVIPNHRQRTDTRAAVLFARLLRNDGEPNALRAWERIDDLGSFIFGPSDDVTPRDLAKIASNAGYDVRAESSLLDVVRIDRIRHAAIEHARAGLADQISMMDRVSGEPVPVVGVRLLGASAPPETEALARLVAPWIPPDSSGRERTLPSALDVGAFLGSKEAFEIDKRSSAFDLAKPLAEAMDRSLPVRDPDACHGSVHLSMLEALASYLAPSAGDPSALVLSSEWSRHKLDVALGAWAALRHDETPFAHRTPWDTAPPSKAAATMTWAVEPHPEAIARLVALVRQIVRGLGARGLMKDGSLSKELATRVLSVLSAALEVSVAEVNGQAPPPEPLLDDLAATFARIEAIAGPLALPLVADVHTDLRSGRVLEVGTRPMDEMWMVLRDPHGFAPTLFVGPHVGHASFDVAPRMTDQAWRARSLSRAEWARAPVVTSTSASP
jgi:hypothetical protein